MDRGDHGYACVDPALVGSREPADRGVAKDIPETNKGLVVFTLRERSPSSAIFVFPISAGGRCRKEIGNREPEHVSWLKDACRCRW